MAFAKITLFTLIFLLGQAYFSTAQSRFQSSFRFDYIFNGISEANTVKIDQNLTLNRIISKPSFSIGAQYDFFVDPKRKISLNFGTLFEFRRFIRFTQFEYESGWSNRNQKHFRSQYFSIPIGITYHFNKLKINASLVNMINLETKLRVLRCNFEEGEACEYRERFSIVNKFINQKEEYFFPNEVIYADNWYHQQLSLGIHYQIIETVSFGLEYRDFIRKNDLHYLAPIVDERFEQQSNSLHLKLLFKL